MMRTKLSDFLGSLSLRARILLFFIIVSNVSVLIIGVISTRLSLDTIRSKADQFNRQMIENVTEKIDDLLAEAQRTSQMVAEDPTIQASLRRPLDADIGRRYSKDLEIDTALNFIQSYKSDILGIYVVGANGGAYKSSFYSLRTDDMRREDWYARIVGHRQPIWFGSHRGSFAAVTVGQSLVTVGVPIMDKAGGEGLGAVLVDLEVELLLRIIRSKLGTTGFIFIVDRDGNVISRPDTLTGSDREATLRRAVEDLGASPGAPASAALRREFLFFSKPSAITGWNIIGVIPTAELEKDTILIRRTITVLLPVICLLDILAAWYFAGVLVTPIKKLMRLMRKVEEGDFSVVMEARTSDEIGQLSEGFNVMVGKIRELMQRVYREHQKMRSAELAALQAQINPHFLYNTLESIVWLSRAGRSRDVIHIVEAMTKLFRIGISGGRELITIRDELEHVKSYLTIQQIRYRDKIDYVIDVPESLGGCRILKLVLQPLVENAIYHGIKNVRGRGTIQVRGREENGDIVLDVVDTGPGMKPEDLRALQAGLVDRAEAPEGAGPPDHAEPAKGAAGQPDHAGGSGAQEPGSGYGLKNIHERLTIFFGPEYGLSFRSEYGRGTTVAVRIPKEADQGGAR